MPDLSILIPTLPKRFEMFNSLKAELMKQSEGYDVEILSWNEETASIGAKRNYLLGWARGKYVAFFDDDDQPGPNYIKLIMEGIIHDVDCCSLTGEITFDGKNPRKFIHSLKYDSWFEKDGIYYRPPNHLNCIRATIAKQFHFPTTNHGEDKVWSMAIQKSGALKTEHEINETIYHYKFISKK